MCSIHWDKRRAAKRQQEVDDFRDSHMQYDDVVTLIGWWKLGGQAAFDEWEHTMQHVQQPTAPVPYGLHESHPCD